MKEANIPGPIIESVRDSVDCNLYFFGRAVPEYAM
jgi:hypothetical protein